MNWNTSTLGNLQCCEAVRMQKCIWWEKQHTQWKIWSKTSCKHVSLRGNKHSTLTMFLWTYLRKDSQTDVEMWQAELKIGKVRNRNTQIYPSLLWNLFWVPQCAKYWWSKLTPSICRVPFPSSGVAGLYISLQAGGRFLELGSLRLRP